MKQTYSLPFCSFLAVLFTCTVHAQDQQLIMRTHAITADHYSGRVGSTPPQGVLVGMEPPHAECIAPELQREISAENERNAERIMREHPGLLPRSRGAHPLFIWPTQPKVGFSDYGYYTVNNLVDHNPAPNGQLLDYNCAARTYDWSNGNHAGTDIIYWPYPWRYMDEQIMEIVAAAPGVIINKRDGFFDRMCVNAGNPNWNGIVLEHADGSESWYWHMKSGAITTKVIGETVEAGEYLGAAGSSGSSTWPHVHFQVMDVNDAVIDPYAGACNSINGTDSWWLDQEDYMVPTINRISTHNSLAYFNDCPDAEITYEDQLFNNGDSIIFRLWFRDLDNGALSTLRLRDPSGTVFQTWDFASPWDPYATAFAGWYNVVDNAWPLGNWTFETDFGGNSYETPFQIGDFSSITGPGASAFTCQPNPTTGLLRLTGLDSSDPNALLRLVNALGEVVLTERVTGPEQTLDVGGVADGVYTLELSTAIGANVQRVVVQR